MIQVREEETQADGGDLQHLFYKRRRRLRAALLENTSKDCGPGQDADLGVGGTTRVGGPSPQPAFTRPQASTARVKGSVAVAYPGHSVPSANPNFSFHLGEVVVEGGGRRRGRRRGWYQSWEESGSAYRGPLPCATCLRGGQGSLWYFDGRLSWC